MFTLRCRLAYFVSLSVSVTPSIAGVIVTGNKLSPMTLLQAINYCQCRWYWRLSNFRCHGIDENQEQGLSPVSPAINKSCEHLSKFLGARACNADS
jgi:hypothetical protein